MADVFDALTSKRPYKHAFPNNEAYEILREGRGCHFDPCILDKFFDMRDEIEEAQRNYQDEAPFASAVL